MKVAFSIIERQLVHDGSNEKTETGVCSTKSGFTLLEMLIVIAIIAVLIAIAIPVFTSQLERSRELVDLSNVRSAYSEVMASAMLNEESSPLHQLDGSYMATVLLEQQQDGWSMDESSLDIAGMQVGDEAWVGTPIANGTCTIQYAPTTGVTTINWRGGNAQYIRAVTPYEKKSLMDLKDMANDDRIEADQTTLRSMGEEIMKLIKDGNWTKRDLYNHLGIMQTGGYSAIRIADFYQQKTGSYNDGETYTSNGFRIESKDNGEFDAILKSIGYNGGNSTTGTADGNNEHAVTYEYSLFYSDELGSNKFGNYNSNVNYGIDKTKRSIIIDNIKTDSNGVITGMNIYSKAMDNQANLDEAQKKKFVITIGS